MNIRFLIAVIASSTILCQVFPQEISMPQSELIETLMEAIASRDGETSDYETLLHEVENLQQNPINLNMAGKEEFQKLFFLTEFQINSLLAYRREHGNMLSIYELGMVYGFTDEVIRIMLPFVTLGNGEAEEFNLKSALKKSHHEVTLKTQHILEKAAGYRPAGSPEASRYPGFPWLFYARYAFESSNHVKAGFTVEEDPGEDFFCRSNRQGFDFNSGYLMVTDVGPVRTFLAGDYRLQFGQGLTLWNGIAPGKSSLPLNIVKRQDAIKAFTATDENDLFRGAATAMNWRRFTLTLFGSSKRRDANITDTLPSGRICFSSFQENGYHRTSSEIADEKSVRENAFGGNLHFRNNWLKMGTTVVQYRLDKDLQKGNDLKDLYAFHGNNLLNWGVDYAATLKKIQLFGETSHGNGSWATLNGMLFNMNKYASFSLLYRNFRPGYFSMHSSAFSEGSADNNEVAIYGGTQIHLFNSLSISAYADFYHSPWLSYRVNSPSSGSDYLVQADFSKGKKVDMFLRLRYETDPKNEEESGPLPAIFSMKRTGLRYHIAIELSRQVAMQNRIEWVRVLTAPGETDHGIMIYQDIAYRPAGLKLSMNFRIAWFNTGTYNSRIYAYEQDMTSGFSFSPLYSRGYRTYLMLRQEVGRHFTCGLRLSQSNFFDRSTVGTGLDLIEGSTRSEIKLQIIARF